MSWDYQLQGVKIFKPELDQFLNSTSGPVGKALSARGRLIVAAAKRQVGVDTGRLRESIGMNHYRYAGGQYLKIGSSNKIALLHHNGTRPHLISTRAQGKMMRFSAGGRVVYTHTVRHPGTRPNRYLSDNLKLARF